MLNNDFGARLAKFEAVLGSSGVDCAVISPGPDLRYLVGYDAIPLERLTALVVRPGHDPVVVSPYLEKSAALASPIGELGLAVETWTETESPFELLHRIIGDVDLLAVDGRMWADKLLKIQKEFTASKALSANPFIATLRQVKSAAETEYLREAGAAIDRVHALVPSFLRVGRTEAEVGKDIAQAILDAGHVTADFVIVGSGPNSASPHHEVSHRVIQSGEAVVVDIGGTMPSGYCSDSTRTYYMGQPDSDFARDFEVLHQAQVAATQAVRPGVTCESIDAVARDLMNEAGIGEFFIHRIGHGIGLETHEEPYMVEGNKTLIEPGFYREGKAGARIEDIVVCGADGALILNNQPRELHIIE